MGGTRMLNDFRRQPESTEPLRRTLSIRGRLTCSTLPNATGIDVSDRAYFSQAIETGGFVISDYLIGKLQGRPILIAALPTRRADGSLDSIIIAGIDLRWIGRLAASATQ